MLRAGRYTIAVTDQSRRTGFVVQQVHGGTTVLSTGSFAGKRTRSIEFRKGQWSFYPTSAGAKSYFIVLVVKAETPPHGWPSSPRGTTGPARAARR